jgi:hypothetical protein
MNTTRLDYGIDAPGVIRNLIVIGFFLLALSWFLPVLTLGPVRFALRPTAIAVGSVCLLEGAAMLLYAKVGKFHHRDRMLARINWTGYETVLDVGTGRGLLMIGAAQKLTTGKPCAATSCNIRPTYHHLRVLYIGGLHRLSALMSGARLIFRETRWKKRNAMWISPASPPASKSETMTPRL